MSPPNDISATLAAFMLNCPAKAPHLPAQVSIDDPPLAAAVMAASPQTPPLSTHALQVSIDGPPLVAAFMAASLALFWCAFRGSELALTAALVYYAMGLAYEFT